MYTQPADFGQEQNKANPGVPGRTSAQDALRSFLESFSSVGTASRKKMEKPREQALTL
jgi:hypothetical protein